MSLSGFFEQIFLVFGVLCGKMKGGSYVIHLQVRVIIRTDYLLGRQSSLKKLQNYVHRDPRPTEARLPVLNLRTYAYILFHQIIHR